MGIKPDVRLAEVEAILDGPRLRPSAPPPRDPYAGWPPITDNPGDSLRPPPGWGGRRGDVAAGHAAPAHA
jgi:hypothetical protein